MLKKHTPVRGIGASMSRVLAVRQNKSPALFSCFYWGGTNAHGLNIDNIAAGNGGAHFNDFL